MRKFNQLPPPPGDMSDSNWLKPHAVSTTRSWWTRCTLVRKTMEPQASYVLQMAPFWVRTPMFPLLSAKGGRASSTAFAPPPKPAFARLQTWANGERRLFSDILNRLRLLARSRAWQTGIVLGPASSSPWQVAGQCVGIEPTEPHIVPLCVWDERDPGTTFLYHPDPS